MNIFYLKRKKKSPVEVPFKITPRDFSSLETVTSFVEANQTCFVEIVSFEHEGKNYKKAIVTIPAEGDRTKMEQAFLVSKAVAKELKSIYHLG